ncbi:hypothetical protein PM082_004115 [Marasmius tenuissimus]|nr:hypothetical protein PM082_004115 [Marasmius tenuissimus]
MRADGTPNSDNCMVVERGWGCGGYGEGEGAAGEDGVWVGKHGYFSWKSTGEIAKSLYSLLFARFKSLFFLLRRLLRLVKIALGRN